jgi:multiple sugar transport system permease protein
MTASSRKRAFAIGFSLLAIAIAIVWFVPFYWAISLSFRRPADTFTTAGLGIPFINYAPTLDNWRTELSTPETIRALTNSTIVSISASVMSLIIGVPAAYALARFRFKRPPNEDLTLWFLSQRILPPIATVVPFLLIMRQLNLIDTRASLILVNITFNLPFAVVIMRQAFLDLPIELEEAALVDGTSYLGAFTRIALRLAAPAMAATLLIVFAFSWNEFLFGLTLGTLRAKTIPVFMAGAVDTRGIQFWFVAVRTLTAIIPPVIIATLAQKYIVQGLTFGAVKG